MGPLQCARSEAGGRTCYAWTSAKPRVPGWGWPLCSPQKSIQTPPHTPPKGIPASCPDLHAVAMKSKSQREPAAAASVGFGDCLILPASSADAKREDWT